MTIKGIIRPPPDIRAVADKTALFVSKNGRAFEQRIMNSEKGQTPKFSFLHDNSPFHAYYEDRIRFYQDGGDKKEDAEMKKEEEKKEDDTPRSAVIRKPAKQEIKSALDPVAKALLDQRKKIREEHDKMEKIENENKDNEGENTGVEANAAGTAIMVTPPPPLLFINITAPRSLTAEEVETIKLVAQFTAFDTSKNFLQNLTIREWNNPSFAFLQPRNAQFAYFSALTDCYKYILDKFVDGKEKKVLSVQDCLNLAAYRAEYEQYVEERQLNNGNENDDANAIDWHDFVVVETIDFGKDETVEPLAMPSEIDKMEESDDEEEGETIRVVPNYTPKVVSSNQADKSQTHVIDPITGKSVPVSQTAEHLRIQLLDPKWAEEKKKFQEKQKESNLVAGDAIATNLSRVVGNVPNTSNLHGDQRRRLEEANRVIREKAQQPPGPMMEPVAKRARLEPHQLPPPPLMYPPGFPPMEGMPPPPPAQNFMPPPPLPIPPHGIHSPSLPQPNVEGAPPIIPGSVVPSNDTPELLSESDFAASLDSPTVTLEISIPNDPTSTWNFNGQTVPIQVDVMTKIKVVKEKLKEHLNNANTNKLQLKHNTMAFLKDTMSLAQLNLGGVVSLDLIPKTRGRRK